MSRERKLRRKIQKYEEKLKRCKSRGRSRSPLRSSTEPCVTRDSRRSRSRRRRDRSASADDFLQRSPTPVPMPAPEVISEDNGETMSPGQIQALQEALGIDYTEQQQFGEEIHKDIARRWHHILIHGLNKTEKEECLKHKTPDNCKLLNAPELNEEVAAGLTESSKLRDKGIAFQQQQLGTALSLIGTAMSNMIKNRQDDQLKILGEAARLMADLHFTQTKTRRMLLAPLLDKNFLHVMDKSIRDEKLYGENLGEKIKTSKLIIQNANSIKKQLQPKNYKLLPENRNGPPRRINQRQPPKVVTRGGPKFKTQPPQPSQPRPAYRQQRPERTKATYHRR